MSSLRRRATDSRSLRIVEFEGKYDIVMPAELRELSDEELVELIMERGEMDESRALEALAIVRRTTLFERIVYERV
jgi:hypothetical protein